MKLSLSFLALALFAQTATVHAAPDYGQLIGKKRLELALVLAQAFDANEICETDAYPSYIIQEVGLARYRVGDDMIKAFVAKLNPKSELHQNLAFRRATGQVELTNYLGNTAELTKALTGTVHFKFGQGVYGSPYNVTLQEGGVADEQTLEVLADEPWYKWHSSTTTWSLVPSKDAPFIGHYLRIGNTEYRIDHSTENDIRFVPKDWTSDEIDFERTLTSDKGYCEA